MTVSTVGTLGSPRRARVDTRGRVTPEGARFGLDWWIGAEDRRHIPAEEASVRQRRVGLAPVVETAMRVPGGDAIQRVYGVGGPADLVAIEIENASPVPFAAALVVCRGTGRRAPRPTVKGNWLLVDREPLVLLPRPPLRRDAQDGDALVYPVAHRTRLRFALVLGRGRDLASDDPGPVLGPDEVARGWAAQLGRGMRVELPDAALQHAVDAARADLLLAPVDADAVAALEDWGFDAEVRTAWPQLSFRARRHATRRPAAAPGWGDVQAARARGGVGFLLSLRRFLVRETGDHGIDLLTELPRDWVGQGLEVHDAPTRRGRVSYAVRWHGPRPALLWECEGADRIRAPGLDPEWSTDDSRGEALLAPHPRFGVAEQQHR
ncbi:MAG: hypothetical protein ACRDY6_19115 [Acidimicrobiia bacterium]